MPYSDNFWHAHKNIPSPACLTFFVKPRTSLSDLFQQVSAPEHHTCETIELLQCETPDFITPDLWPPNCPDLNRMDYRIWGVLQERVYWKSVKNVDELKRHLVEAWLGIQQGVIRQLTNGKFALMRVSKPKESTLNTFYDVLCHNCQ